MCGIVACRTRRPALDFLLPGLRRLEYRGYDSAGVAAHTTTGEVVRVRSVGRLDSLERRITSDAGPIFGGTGIGHTRWATHGGVTEQNSHPHAGCGDEVHVVHNGIIENADELRSDLALRGHVFASVVDSETVAHLVEEALHEGADLAEAVDKTCARLVGSWALAVLRRGDPAVVVTAHRSPLVVAVNDAGTFAASDMTALAGWSDHVQVVEDGDVVVLGDGHLTWRRADGSRTAPSALATSATRDAVELGDARDYMAKEISEQRANAMQIIDRLSDGIVDGSVWRDLGLPPLSRARFVISFSASKSWLNVTILTGSGRWAAAAINRPTGPPRLPSRHTQLVVRRSTVA